MSREAISAGVENDPKGRRGRQLPSAPAAPPPSPALGRRDDFASPTDGYVLSQPASATTSTRRLTARRYKRCRSRRRPAPHQAPRPPRRSAGSILARAVPLVTVHHDVLGNPAGLRATNRYLHTKIVPGGDPGGQRRVRRGGDRGGRHPSRTRSDAALLAGARRAAWQSSSRSRRARTAPSARAANAAGSASRRHS